MAITTATELKAALAAWLDRADLADYLDDFIVMAEGHFNRNLRHRKMEAITDLTPTNGVCTLPTDYLRYRRVVEKASQRRNLSFVAPEYADQQYASRQTGLACDFSIIGSSLYTFPLAQNDIELTYVQKIPSLTANSTNWLLAESPELYLRGSQMMALEFINETASPRFAVVTGFAERQIEDLNSENELALYAKAPMRAARISP